MNKYQKALKVIWFKTDYKDYSNKTIDEVNQAFGVLEEGINRLEKLEKDLKYISEQDFQIYRFPNGRIIFGVDITNCPSEQEKVKRILEEVLKNENFL